MCKPALRSLVFILLLGCNSFSEAKDDAPVEIKISHGLEVAAENRCSTYDRDDYRYPQSVKQRIVDNKVGSFRPMTCNAFNPRVRRILNT